MAESTPLHPTNTKPGIKDTTQRLALENTTITETVLIPDKSTSENNTSRPISRETDKRNEFSKITYFKKLRFLFFRNHNSFSKWIFADTEP